uniref:Uncharacterized protein n=1 Tax=Romanomermis culicivorax TaxID=13658 RepID=A0A915I901_ROMCU
MIETNRRNFDKFLEKSFNVGPNAGRFGANRFLIEQRQQKFSGGSRNETSKYQHMITEWKCSIQSAPWGG